MNFSYKFPLVYADQKPIGTLVEALQSHKDFSDAIMSAHAIAWANASEASEDQASLLERQRLVAENAELRRRLMPDLGPIVDALRGVGLYQWMADAANKDPDLLDEIAAMNAAAIAGDIPALVANYAAIVAAFPPDEDLLRSWQAVLDAAGVPPQILAFIR